jgi:hypothetical protein
MNAVLLAEKDADKLALDDLKKQVKQQTGIRAEITQSKIEELQAQIKAENKMKSILDDSRKRFLKSLESAVKATDPLSLLTLSNDQLNQFIINGGFGFAIDEFLDQSENIADKIKNSMLKMQPDLALDKISNRLDIMKVATIQSVFDDVVIPSVAAGVRDSLSAIVLDVPIKQAISGLSQKMKSSTGTQLTQINTKLSMFGRSVSAEIAKEANINYYLYTGPMDGVTRDFCKQLVDKVVSESQMKRLRNGQGLPVKTACGGYNCRHSWTPVTKGFIKAANLQRAKNSDITKANQ